MRHTTRSAAAVGAAATAVLLIVGAALVERQSSGQVVVRRVQLAAPAQPPVAIVDVPGLMRLFNGPLYGGLRERMARPPETQEQWDELVARGLQAAEVANLVALRPVEPDRPGWTQGAAAMQQAGVALSDAAREQQWEQVRQAYQGLVQSCNTCHQTRAPDRAPQLEL